jgi:fructuronate reductase
VTSSTTGRLCRTALSDLPAEVRRPGYDPAGPGVGIVHLGVGAFHRAHQAVYTDDALAAEAGDWRILGVSLRSPDIADALNPQDGLYTLLERGTEGTAARIVGSIGGVIVSPGEPGAALAAMSAPETRIVSLTVTEKAYGIDRAGQAVLADHPSVAPDLAAPRAPQGTIGLLSEALRLRRDDGLAPFTVLCCDNLPENGALLRAGVLDFARRTDPALADWIGGAVAFPSTMVDRITPAPTDATLAEAARRIGLSDLGAVETEAFSQWVIEDRFTAGRPAWEAGGAIFVDDVAPYERMKLRMLNGTHSMLAYAGFLSGRRYVRDVMADPSLARIVARHLRAAAGTLAPLAGIDLDDYARALAERFANPAIAHETYQIAMDGTEKLPQRLLAPAAELEPGGGDRRPFAFAVAAWMRYALGRTDAGEPYTLRDPREAEIARAIAGAGAAEDMVSALHALPGLFPAALAEDAVWKEEVAGILAAMLERGMAGAVALEAGRG